MADSVDKRSWPRLPVVAGALAVEARETGTGESYVGQTRDLSAGGCFIEHAATPRIGAEVRLFICNDEGREALRSMARVVRVEPGAGFAVEFLHADDKARADIAAFIEKVKKPSL